MQARPHGLDGAEPRHHTMMDLNEHFVLRNTGAIFRMALLLAQKNFDSRAHRGHKSVDMAQRGYDCFVYKLCCIFNFVQGAIEQLIRADNL